MDRPFDEPSDAPFDGAVDGSVDQAVDGSVGQPVDEPIYGPSNEAVDGPVHGPVARPGLVPSPLTEEHLTVDYMLESWDSIESTCYKASNLYLEHLILKGENEAESQESLRLATQPLIQRELGETVLERLFEPAFKIAAQMSTPSLFDRPIEASPSVLGKQKRGQSHTQVKADQSSSIGR